MKFVLLLCVALCAQVNGDALDSPYVSTIIANLRPVENYPPPTITRYYALIWNGAYDAIVPYLDNAVALYSTIAKRPAAEQTLRNKNIAAAYAIYRVAVDYDPRIASRLRTLYQSVGLNVDNTTLDLTTPIGIGNFAAQKVIEVRHADGMNQLGDLNGKSFNKKAYEDYTGYKPKNTAYELDDPTRWQPLADTNVLGGFTVQEHSVPQMAVTKPFAMKNAKKYKSPKPPIRKPLNITAYKDQVDGILAASANLNDYRKISAEHFNDRFRSQYNVITFLSTKYNLNQDDYIKLGFVYSVSLFDSIIVIFQQRMKYDVVRPISAVRYLYSNENITAWAGPGLGTINYLKGKEWRSYVAMPASSEYPGGTACNCAAAMEATKKFLNSNDFGFAPFQLKGSSVIEPGITPAANMTLGPYNTFDDYTTECKLARIWGGLHYTVSSDEGVRLCIPIGQEVATNLMKYFDGSISFEEENEEESEQESEQESEEDD